MTYECVSTSVLPSGSLGGGQRSAPIFAFLAILAVCASVCSALARSRLSFSAEVGCLVKSNCSIDPPFVRIHLSI